MNTLSTREISITREVDATPEQLFNAWTNHLPEWWAPRPLTTPVSKIDLRPGGYLHTVMRTPDGQEYPTHGVFLEIVKNRRIVLTDAFLPGWEPSNEAFFTAIISFDPLAGSKTRYTARALHWNEANCQKHKEMGFHEGWNICLDQLIAIAVTL